MRPATMQFVIASTLLLAFATPRPALADWPPSGRALTTAPDNQDIPRIASDGAGGAIVTWRDFGSGRVNLFARRVESSGEPDAAWPLDGLAVLTDSLALATALGGQDFPVIASDGSGGAIIAWQDGRSDPTGADIYAQHVLSSGLVDPNWPANGTVLCAVTGVQDIPTIVSDGAGGAIVTWMDGRSGGSNIDVYAQRVLASGVVDPNWPVNGTALCTAPSPQAFPNIVSDGSGGAIVTWYDFRPSATGIDIYAQHVSGSGAVDPAWPANGRALCTAANAQFNPTIASDGAHGAIVSWHDSRDGSNHIYAQRVLASGAVDPAWPVNGRAVCTAPIEQIDPVLVSDDRGGAIVAWRDARDGTHIIYAQHVLATGAVDPAWPVNGRALDTVPTEHTNAAIVGDGTGGAFVSWQDGFDVFVQHVLAFGALDPTFPVPDALALCALPGRQANAVLVADGANGAIAAWTDSRSGTDSDIFALQVLAAGTVSVPHSGPPAFTFAGSSPNPARQPLMLRFALVREAGVRLAVYDLTGRRVRDLVFGTRPAGDHAISWDLRDERGEAVDAGVYFARLEVGQRTVTQKLIRLK